MQLRHLYHKQNRRNSLTGIFQLIQGAAWVSVSLSVWTPDCYAHTHVSVEVGRTNCHHLKFVRVWVFVCVRVCVTLTYC